MKRIIDIPDNEYRHIKEYYEKNDIVEATYSYIYHGTPLDDVFDKIRAEIETKYGQCDICEYFEEDDISEYRGIGDIADILQIIDKYKAESEECFSALRPSWEKDRNYERVQKD